MKKYLWGLGLLTALRVSAQDVTFSCSYEGSGAVLTAHGFETDDLENQSSEIPALVDRILQLYNLPAKIQVQVSSQVNNASAAARDGEPYILYNKYFVEAMRSKKNGNWKLLGIFAHEVGHHMLFHTMKHSSSRPDLELEADKWAGSTLFQLGATLEQALSCFEAVSEKGTLTHPARDLRKQAMQKGWYEAKEVPIPKLPENGNLHIIISNTTNDEKLSPAINESMLLLENHFQKVSQYTHLKRSRNYLEKPSDILSLLQNLKCEENDVVFFIHIGHGFNPENGDKFPAYIDDNLRYSHQWLQKKLKEKNPRLLIMFLAANNYISGPKDSSGMPRQHINSFFYENEQNANNMDEKEIYNKFYLYAKGDISLSSATLGAYSYSKTNDGIRNAGGSFFVESFVQAFDNSLCRGSWQQLLWHVREQTHLSTKAAIHLCAHDWYNRYKTTTFYPYFEGNIRYK